LKEATMTRIRTATLAAKLAAAALVAALATGGLAGAGVISLPGESSQTAKDAVPAETGSDASQQNVNIVVERGKSNEARGNGNGKGSSAQGEVGTQQQGDHAAQPDPEDLREFGNRVSGDAQDGGVDGQEIAGEAQNLVPRPGQQQAAQGSRETGESFSQQGQGTAQQGQGTGEGASQGGQEIAGSTPGGGRP
jgi:hypothetical protein